MSLNKFMHQRNRYKNKKPSFLALALKYPEFRAHTTQDDSGKVFIDFKNAEALRALTTCLLKEDFGLTVDLPQDRLVPTLPLRLNYIHWLEDIVGTDENKWGIDIGTGASCIYPVLASSMNKWHFLATEADPENFVYANKNVTANGLQDLIHVKQVTSEDILVAPLQSFNQTSKFDFCMCNPPFFADHMEAQAITNTRSAQRPEAGSVSTASPQECIAQGGEVGFVRHMIEESTVLKDKIRVYTSMVGKKTSLQHLKEDLKHHKVVKYSTTEFCQGKTMRWGIAWTFDVTVNFPKSSFETRKEKPPLQYIVPKGAGGVPYKVHEIAAYLQRILESIKFHCYQGKKAKSYTSITLTAVENTWCHQRRLRRQHKHQQGEASPTKQPCPVRPCVRADGSEHTPELQKRHLEDSGDPCSSSAKRFKADDGAPGGSVGSGVIGVATSETTSPVGIVPSKGSNGHVDPSESLTGSSPVQDKIQAKESDQSRLHPEISLVENDPAKESCGQVDQSDMLTDSSPTEYILKCVMRLKRVDEQVVLELEWLAGESRELMHQVLTFIKNKLTSKC